MVSASEMSFPERVTAAERVRRKVLSLIEQTDDLVELPKQLACHIDSYEIYVGSSQTLNFRNEILRELTRRLDADITRFDVDQQGTASDPVHLIPSLTAKKTNGQPRELDVYKLQKHIMLRLCDDLAFNPLKDACKTMDYFYGLAATLNITLDDKKVEETILNRAAQVMDNGNSMKTSVMAADFLDANLPVGPNMARLSHKAPGQLVEVNKHHYFLDI